MTLRFFNSLTRRKTVFAPLEPGRVRLYTCGPTVYHFAHIGNFRAYMFEDILRRALEYAGYAVEQVMNLTDVDDKTIRAANDAGQTLEAYTRPFVEAFFEDLKTLNIRPAEHYPAATAHIPQMIRLIRRLLDRGFAYRAADGSVYFSVARFPGYGRLANLDLTTLKPGARVAQDEYDKEGVGDFALWKAWTAADGAVAWDAPWGRGRPGWHIECSAMCMHYLGEQIDLHTGGIDNLFPHHENEIAQSEAATGKPFVHTWMHCAHLQVEGAKMSKSLGNFFTLRDLTARGFGGREIRYVLMAGHYRQPLNFTFEALAAARVALGRIDGFAERLEAAAARDKPSPATPSEAASDDNDMTEQAPTWMTEARTRFEQAIADDLNLPEALAALFDALHNGNRALDRGAVPPLQARAAWHLLTRKMDAILGLRPGPGAEPRPDPEIQVLVDARAHARSARDWSEADRLRDRLRSLGWLVQDTPEGQKVKAMAP